MDRSHHLEKGLKSTAPGEPRMVQGMKRLSTTAHVHTAPWTSLISSRGRNLTLSGKRKPAVPGIVQCLCLVRALPSHFTKVICLRTCLMEISGRIVAILGHAVMSFLAPILSHCRLLNFAGCEHASGYKLYFYYCHCLQCTT